MPACAVPDSTLPLIVQHCSATQLPSQTLIDLGSALKEDGDSAGTSQCKEAKHTAKVLPSRNKHGWRIPLAHCSDDAYLPKLQETIDIFLGKWKAHLENEANVARFKHASRSCQRRSEGDVEVARTFMKEWLRQHFLEDCRCTLNVELDCSLLAVPLWVSNGVVGKLLGDVQPEVLPNGTGVWDLHMTDFEPVENGDLCIQWYGTNLHELSALATHVWALGGCTAKGLAEACQYSVPHIFEADNLKVLVRCILLVALSKATLSAMV